MNNNKLKIAFIANPDSIHNIRWISYFADKGYDVSVITLWKNKESIKGVKYYFLDEGVKGESGFTLFKESLFLPKTFPKEYIAVAHRLKKLLKEINPDILHAQYIGIWAVYAALANFTPLVLTAWGGDILEEQWGYVDKNYKEFIKYAVKKADLITCDCNDVCDKLKDFGAKKTIKIQFGADLNKFKPGLDTKYWKDTLKLHGKKVVLSPRHIDPIYDIETIIKAAALVKDKLKEVVFILKDYRGSSDYKEKMKRQVLELGLSENIRFLDEVDFDAMPNLYNAADIYLSVPVSDGMPVSLFEAMATGAVPVISNLPAPCEVVRDGVNGAVVNVGDWSGLSSAIVEILENEEVRRKMREINYRKVKEEGDYHKNMRIMEEFYKDLKRVYR